MVIPQLMGSAPYICNPNIHPYIIIRHGIPVLGHGHLRPGNIPGTSSFNGRRFGVLRFVGKKSAGGVKGSQGKRDRDYLWNRRMLGVREGH